MISHFRENLNTRNTLPKALRIWHRHLYVFSRERTPARPLCACEGAGIIMMCNDYVHIKDGPSLVLHYIVENTCLRRKGKDFFYVGDVNYMILFHSKCKIVVDANKSKCSLATSLVYNKWFFERKRENLFRKKSLEGKSSHHIFAKMW